LQLNFNTTQNKTIIIRNILGQEVKCVITNDASIKLKVSELIPGVYFITSQTKNSASTKKFVKD